MKRISFVMLLICSLIIVSCGDDKPKDVYKNKNQNAPKAEKPAEEIKKDANATIVPPEELAKAKEIIAASSKDAIAEVDAKAKFNMLCAACHGKTGNLNVNGAKDLTVSTISLEESVAQVYHGRGLMTPFKGILKDHEIVAVGKYIETLRK